MNQNALYAQRYTIDRDYRDITRVHVEFIIPISPSDTEKTANFLKNLELFLSGSEGVALVQGNEKPRCFFCGVLNEPDNKLCDQCGAPL